MKLYVSIVDFDNGGIQKIYDIIPNVRQNELNGAKYSKRIGLHSGHPGPGNIHTGQHFCTSNDKDQRWF